MSNTEYTVESVLSGHPDKICDQISDALLDFFLVHDKNSHTAIECLGTGSKLIVAGEINSSVQLPIEECCVNEYNKITGASIEVINLLSQQSNQLNAATLNGGAGDQGVMYGYACQNQYNCLPYGYWLVNLIARRLDNYRKSNYAFLSDGKIQATIENRFSVKKLSINIQHQKDADLNKLRSMIIKDVLYDVTADVIEINPFGLFVNGGFSNDTGLTGRKIMVDTYGGIFPHGGGAFSGKDPSKVDRSAAYMCRYVAKNIVSSSFAQECSVSVAYEFGQEHPVMLSVITDGNTNKNITEFVKENFDFRPQAIIERLNLKNISYLPTATYGHFTDPAYTWEEILYL